MMGYQSNDQGKLFYTQFNLEKRVRQTHVLRKVAKHIDFDFIYQEVENKYGSRGNVSVPPPVILKAMLLLIFYNVRSERELMDTLPERLDWLLKRHGVAHLNGLSPKSLFAGSEAFFCKSKAHSR